MDFHSLARKELQALCKKNKIPANLTNVAMADALKALDKVEGLDELGNAEITKPEPQTAGRTTTRRKAVKVEPESSQILSRTRRTTRTVAEEGEDEIKHVILQKTPVPTTNQRRGPAASICRKIDTQLMERGDDEIKQEVEEKRDVPESPAVYSRRKVETRKYEKSVQQVYSTRHSARLLEKTMADLSLKEEKKIEAVKFEGVCEETKEVEQLKDLPGESLEIECDKYEAVEDNKTNDYEVDQLLENNKSDECEVDNQFLSERNIEIVEDCNKADDTETTDCHIKLENETCDNNSDDLSGFETEDLNDSSNTLIQSENSDKAIDMIDQKGSDAHKTENSEKNMLETEMEKELICSQYESDTVIKTEDALIVDAQDVVNSWTAEEPSEAANINTEVNEEQHMAVDMENKPDEINAIISQNDCQEFDSDSEETKSPSLVSDLTLDEDHGIPVEEFNSTQAFYEKTPTPLSPCISAAKDSNVFKDCQELAQQESPCMVSDSTLDDDHEIPAEEFDNSIQTAALSPCIAVAKVCSPFAGNTIQGQFPRPTSAAPNKQPTLEIDINKENTNSGRDVDYKELLNEMSLRQLNKALREKLQIKNNVVPKEDRMALQKLPENGVEPGN